MAEPPDFASIQRRGAKRRRTRTIFTSAAAAVVVAMGAVGLSLVNGTEGTAPSPAPDPTLPPTPTGPPPGWPGALRPDGVTLPVVSLAEGRADGRDAAVGGFDIHRIRTTPSRQLEWRLELRGASTEPSSPGPQGRVVEHGLVFDSDFDRIADCRIGLNASLSNPEHFSVWVTNLRTGVTDEQVGGPYGIPIDFAHPGVDKVDTLQAPMVSFFFLTSRPEPCDPFLTANFYAYAVVTDPGRDPKWDFAPDAAWLEMSS